jgi:DNA-binding transcriptional LysR family regulator
MTAFTRTVEKGSIAAAALDIGVTPSALSKILTRLEERLGIRLLTRTTRRLTLTGEGEIYYARCKDILALIESAEAEISLARESPRGHLRVNVGTAIAKHRLTPILPEFLARYPDISVDLGITDRVIDMMTEQVDVAIRMGILEDSSLVMRKIVDTRRVICAAPAYLEKHGIPRHPSDLSRHNCLLLNTSGRAVTWPFLGADGINRMEVRGKITSDSADFILEMALAGEGIVRLGDFLVAKGISDGLLVPLLEEQHASEPLPVSAVTLPGKHRAPRIQAFIDFLIEKLRAPHSTSKVL